MRRMLVISSAALLVACAKSTTTAPPTPSNPSPTPSVTPIPSVSSTPSPTPEVKGPLSEARVEGSFHGGGFFGSGYKFQPACGKNACNVVATGSRHARLLFKYDGKSYKAHDTTQTTCGNSNFGTQITVHLTWEFKVSKAADVHGEWRATQLDASSTASTSGGSTSRTFGNTRQTLTCKATDKKDHGKQYLQGH